MDRMPRIKRGRSRAILGRSAADFLRRCTRPLAGNAKGYLMRMHDSDDMRRGGVVCQSARSSTRFCYSAGLLVVIALVLSVLFSAQGRDTLTVGDHTFESLGVTYNDDGTSTRSYRVTSGNKPSLSHWVLEWDPSLRESKVIDASEIYEVNTEADLQQD